MRREIIKGICALLITLFTFQVFAQTNSFSVESLNFEGLKKTKSHFLSRIAKVKPGLETDSLTIITDIERFKRLDGIAYADYKVEPNGTSGYNVTYIIEENFSIIPGLRIGQASDDSFSYRFSAFEFNGLGRNIIFGGFYKKEVFNGFGVFLEHPYLLTNKLGLGVNYIDDSSQQPIFFNPDDVENSNDFIYTTKGPEVTLFYELNFHNRFELGVKASKEEYMFINTNNEDIVNIPEPSISRTAYRGSYEYVDLDIEYQNVSGFRNLFEASIFTNSNDLLQTDYMLNNTTQYFKRIGDKGNLATQLQLQISNPINKSVFAPLTIDNQLNIRGAGNIIDRGVAIAAINSEYRYTLIEKKWFVLQSNSFVDVSGVQRPNADLKELFSSDTTRVQTGLGLRFIHKYIFNAVLRFDYGVNITGNGGNGVVFGIGQFF
ncbi:BamA/TamA family outer membrane protein [Seonamhaeicola marinus]|uniref:Outer membrane protein assembly factor n=1 Tax=Seonamhaeicola marinus TaxID=1912246 RepID=A0A5D0HIL2_9FLAO|nr:outer membrane protein assembly factor [Seonamhaeicola marinus]TYA69887.1 outer membrane protein assembly factor [Seonamhaeicola marinus]